MAPSPFLPYPDSANASFTCFNRLPLELRLVVWKFALPGPRIVHLSQRLLQIDKDPDWWRRVRSDKVIEGPPLPAPYPEGDEQDMEDYGYFDIDDYEAAVLERELARKRLLTRDEDYNGPMTKATAKQILARRTSRTRVARPSRLTGFWSESETPAVLLVCKESFVVASKFYTRAFCNSGALAQTYFDFHRDTLYLDGHSVACPYSQMMSFGLPYSLGHLFPCEELARIQNFAMFDRHGFLPPIGLEGFQRVLPNLKVLTIVSHHFTRGADISSKTTADFQYLKYVEATTDSVTGDYRIRGFRVDHSICKPPMPIKSVKDEDMKFAKRQWQEKHPGTPWIFRIEYKSLIPEAEEKRILQQALDFEKKNNAGCWYINPQDKTDCDYYVDAEEDEDATLLPDT